MSYFDTARQVKGLFEYVQQATNIDQKITIRQQSPTGGPQEPNVWRATTH